MTRAEKINAFNTAVLSWYRKNGRTLAWRNTTDPYRIVVSELMLQQTQVDRVRTKYANFLKAFPDVASLANASIGDVLTVWSGLGYNRRALYLKKMSEEIQSTHAGKFPNDRASLLALPGIGMSTASALRSFAFGADDPMIDTNVRRILRRVFFPYKEMSDKNLYEFALHIIPAGKGREWNYAVMDIAALHCKASSHGDECPIAHLHGNKIIKIYKKPQKTFVGSDRYYRGAILQILTKKGKATIPAVAATFDIETGKVRKIAQKMHYEGLVMLKNNTITFPNKRSKV